ncbi:MAG: DUF3575 domain-containing protein [Rikenellaceae bacterium]
MIANTMKCRVTLVVLMVVFCAQAMYAQQVEDSLEIYFRQDVSMVEEDTGDNKKSLDRLSKLFDKITTDSLTSIVRIEINSWTSPEPGKAYNDALSRRRSDAIRDYILARWSVPDSILVAKGNGVAWDKLRAMVAESDMQYRDQVLDVIDNVPIETWRRVKPTDRWMTLVDSRQKRLMDLQGGKPYRYMYNTMFPALRYGSQVSVFYSHQESLSQNRVVEKLLPLPEIELPQIVTYQESREPILALKTNLLYDVVTVVNVEAEVPIGEKYSIAAEWIFPWWVSKDNGTALQLLSGSVEGKYWFGDRTNVPKLTGWFGGVYVGGGLYDFQWKDNGYQGEFYIAAGLSAGYAHTINRSETLRLEYSLGMGYLNTDYRYYEGRQNNEYLVWQHDGRYRWIGPTKAKVSLVWMLHRKKGGVR